MSKDLISSIFGENVFNDDVMREYLPKPIYTTLHNTIEEGADLDQTVANAVAHAMKEWALERGATHFTHWFQPLNGFTAEKHDSFLKPIGNGKIITEFSGKELMKGEPDASSFPSGGLRATFEARGYTAWDCTSPAFLKKDSVGVVLCIPTIFCSYNGEALDKKTPLLRSIEAIDKQTKRILKLFGDTEVKRISCSVGPEQEYFLIDHNLYMKREDLIFTGRTLFGCKPPKGQELDDHYFGSIKERVASYMKEINEELWKLGVNAKTQHNEVAPAQHELAPVYTTANVACDHNQLTMEIMKKVAKRHGLECLLHEKPFAGVNGSGKHNNWSICTDTGKNLLEPGKTPHENAQFLLFLTAVIKAVDENALLLRLVASNPGNDHRLGANEAPPAIISIFLGEQLTDIVDQIIHKGEAKSSKSGGKLDIGVHSLPLISKDNTDRNRTSPFAFTGNKFEFRMVGSSISIASVNTALNVCVADALSEMADKLEKSQNFSKALKKLIRDTLTEHSRIIFDGNGYSNEWIEEAKRRGLPNAKSFIDAVPALTDPKTIEMYRKHNILTKNELQSRAEIDYEMYSKQINIESLTMVDMANRLYIPATMKYIDFLAKSVQSIKNCGIDVDCSTQEIILKDVSKLLKEAKDVTLKLSKLEKEAFKYTGKEQAYFYKDKVVPTMESLRKPIDSLEQLVGKEYWPVPSYSQLLFDI